MRSVAVVAWAAHNSCSFPGVFFLFRLVSNFNTLKALILLVHAGLKSYFRNPLNADMDCRIFNVHM